LRQAKKRVLDYEKVKADCSEWLCDSVEVAVGDRRVALLGFDPVIETVQRDVRKRETWVSLRIGTRHNSLLILCFEPDRISGIVLVDQESIIASSIVCFSELAAEYGCTMTELHDRCVYVDALFWQTVIQPSGDIPPRAVVVNEVQYSRPQTPRPEAGPAPTRTSQRFGTHSPGTN
jgi:hypothetical protein